MTDSAEKRACLRFEVPNGQTRYKKKGLLVLLSGYSEAYPVVNISKGGIAFECDEAIRRGTKLTVQLLAPEEEPLELNAEVRWQRRHAGGQAELGVQFAPFGTHRGWNSIEDLEALRKLEAQYGEGANEGSQEEEQEHEAGKEDAQNAP